MIINKRQNMFTFFKFNIFKHKNVYMMGCTSDLVRSIEQGRMSEIPSDN